MTFTLKQIADIIHGEIEGDENATVDNLSKIEEGKEGTLSFLANPKYTHYIYNTSATAVIVGEDFIPERSVGTNLIRVKDPYSAFATLLEAYNKLKQQKTGISDDAVIKPSAEVGKDVYIGDLVYIGEKASIGNQCKIFPHVYIGDHTSIGKDTIIYSGVRIYEGTVIGNNCIIHSGAVLGSDGFGFAPQEKHHYKKVAQIGNVIVEDDVEIGSNTTIDRATLGSTILRKGVKLDNLIQVAHNVEIGEHTVIAAQTGISGSTKIGKNCMIGGQVGIVGHLTIGNNVRIAAQAGIGSNIKDGETVMGSPAFEIGKYRKSYVHFKNLDKHISILDELRRKIL